VARAHRYYTRLRKFSKAERKLAAAIEALTHFFPEAKWEESFTAIGAQQRVLATLLLNFMSNFYGQFVSRLDKKFKVQKDWTETTLSDMERVNARMAFEVIKTTSAAKKYNQSQPRVQRLDETAKFVNKRRADLIVELDHMKDKQAHAWVKRFRNNLLKPQAILYRSLSDELANSQQIWGSLHVNVPLGCGIEWRDLTSFSVYKENEAAQLLEEREEVKLEREREKARRSGAKNSRRKTLLLTMISPGKYREATKADGDAGPIDGNVQGDKGQVLFAEQALDSDSDTKPGKKDKKKKKKKKDKLKPEKKKKRRVTAPQLRSAIQRKKKDNKEVFVPVPVHAKSEPIMLPVKPPEQTKIPFRALWDYKAEGEGELPFSAGDIVMITDQADASWWLAELNGNAGWVPRNFLLPELSPATPHSASTVQRSGELGGGSTPPVSTYLSKVKGKEKSKEKEEAWKSEILERVAKVRKERSQSLLVEKPGDRISEASAGEKAKPGQEKAGGEKGEEKEKQPNGSASPTQGKKLPPLPKMQKARRVSLGEKKIGNPADWAEFVDAAGEIYYHNAKIGQSSWDAPPGFYE